MTSDDRAYYLKRAAEEDEAAAAASCAVARECHEELAALYRARSNFPLDRFIPASSVTEQSGPVTDDIVAALDAQGRFVPIPGHCNVRDGLNQGLSV